MAAPDAALKGGESHRQYARTSVLSDRPVTAEAIRSMTLYLGEGEVERERREIGDGVTSVAPLIEVIREYARLDFPFEAEAARGEPHPPETPPREEPDYG